MCFQGFVYFACGHNHIYDKRCEKISDHPFALQVNCPDYQSASSDFTTGSGRFPRSCGIGQFYCAYDQDGDFLDHTHRAQKDAQNTVANIDRSLVELKEIAERFTVEADKRGLSKAAQKAQPQHAKLVVAHNDWIEKRNKAQATVINSTSIIHHAQAWHQGKTQHKVSGIGSAYRAFVPPVELPRHVTDVLGNVSSYGAMPSSMLPGSKLAPMTPIVETAPKPTKPVKSRFLASWQLPPEEVQQAIASHQRNIVQNGAQQMQPPAATVAKRSLPKKRYVEDTGSPVSIGRPRHPQSSLESSPKPEAGIARRSARVQNKRVKYNEDTDSSRDTSPNKSDASGFSPTKSDPPSSDFSDSLNRSSSSRRVPSRKNKLPLRRTSKQIQGPNIGTFNRSKLPSPSKPEPVPRPRTKLVLRDLLNSTPEKPTLANTMVRTNGAQMASVAPLPLSLVRDTPAVTAPVAVAGVRAASSSYPSIAGVQVPGIPATVNQQQTAVNGYTGLWQDYGGGVLRPFGGSAQPTNFGVNGYGMQQQQQQTMTGLSDTNQNYGGSAARMQEMHDTAIRYHALHAIPLEYRTQAMRDGAMPFTVAQTPVMYNPSTFTYNTPQSRYAPPMQPAFPTDGLYNPDVYSMGSGANMSTTPQTYPMFRNMAAQNVRQVASQPTETRSSMAHFNQPHIALPLTSSSPVLSPVKRGYPMTARSTTTPQQRSGQLPSKASAVQASSPPAMYSQPTATPTTMPTQMNDTTTTIDCTAPPTTIVSPADVMSAPAKRAKKVAQGSSPAISASAAASMKRQRVVAGPDPASDAHTDTAAGGHLVSEIEWTLPEDDDGGH